MDFMRMRWYPVVDDTIGGWALCTVNAPISRHPSGPEDFQVGNFIARDVAEHIADLHNAWLKDGNSPAYLAEVAERARAQRDVSLCGQGHGATPCPVCGSTSPPNEGS